MERDTIIGPVPEKGILVVLKVPDGRPIVLGPFDLDSADAQRLHDDLNRFAEGGNTKFGRYRYYAKRPDGQRDLFLSLDSIAAII